MPFIHDMEFCQEGLMSGIIQMEKEDEMFNLSSEAKLMMMMTMIIMRMMTMMMMMMTILMVLEVEEDRSSI